MRPTRRSAPWLGQLHELGSGLDLLVADQFTDAFSTHLRRAPDAVLLARPCH